MELTKRQQYGLKGLIYLAGRLPGEAVSMPEICEATGLPQNYLMKIFQDLARAGLVISHRGIRGGFSLARPAGEISLKEALEALGGALFPESCLLGNPVCNNEAACPVHEAWEEARRRFLSVLESITLAQVAGSYSGAGEVIYSQDNP